jgi:hypothetical protein
MLKNNKSYSILKITHTQDKYFENEQAVHLMYLKNYLVHPCNDYCNNENCIKYHAGQNPRRRPFINYEGTWSYTPKLCQNPQPCRIGNKCRYSHTKEESNFHPLVYKVTECKYPTLEKGKCSRWGQHCSFAHTEDDKRLKVIPSKTIEVFDSLTYKTSECGSYNCNSAECLKYHDSAERRRPLNKFSYSSKPCGYVYKNHVFGHPDNCPNKDNCHLSHTKNEVCYHPFVYKTKDCKAAPCYSKYCPFKHPQDLLRPGGEEQKADNRLETEEKPLEIDQSLKEEEEKEEKNQAKEAKEENIFSETSDKVIDNTIPSKIACKYCKQRIIKWKFECGSMFCSRCIGNSCMLCNKRHLILLET